MKDVTSMIENVTGLKVALPRYLPDEQVSQLTDEQLITFLDHWHDSKIGMGLKKCVTHACMGLPLQNEVERRWREGL